MAYASIPDTGLLVDAAPWAHLRFAEGPGLHFKPPEPAPKEASHG
jgi:hypothetical protein